MVAARIRIEVSTDEMAAQLSVVPGDPADADVLRGALEAAGVTFGIDESAFASVAARLIDPTFACALPIASGRPMRRESHDVCALVLEVGLQAGHALDDGNFDYRERGLLTPVKCGQRVAHCEPEVVGLEGRTVTDRVIPFEHLLRGEPLVFGEGLLRGDDGDVLATRDGAARRLQGHVIAVGDHYLHKGDVDMHSGNLEMRGGVTVSGDVTAKFEVQATGDVEVGKSVLKGIVYGGGSVSVRQGVLGGPGTGAVMAEIDIVAEHAQDAELRCGGSIHLRRSAIHCDVHAACIRVDGAVRGGMLHAEHEIVVGAAGAAIGGETELAVGVAVERPIRARFDEQRRERHRLDRLGAKLAVVGVHARRVAPTTAADGVEVAQSQSLTSNAHVDVLGMIHAGSAVVIGTHRLVLDRAQSHRRFSLDPETRAIRSDPLP